MATGTTIRMVTLLAGFVAVALVTLPRQLPAGQPGR